MHNSIYSIWCTPNVITKTELIARTQLRLISKFISDRFVNYELAFL